MKVIGLLSWYDESPIWLGESVIAASHLCDHVVALDGAYDLFPDGKPQSPFEQAKAILGAARWADIGCTLMRPETAWAGNQIEKRSTLFRLGAAVADPGDWYFVFDADDLVLDVPSDTRKQLFAASEDVAVYTFGSDRYHRGLFRALPGLRVEDAHYHYVAERGDEMVHLRGNDAIHTLEPFLNLTHLRVHHRKAERSKERVEAAAEYHRRVSEEQIEKTTPEEWAAVPA